MVSLDADALERALAAAAQLEAPRLKMSIGGFDPALARLSLPALKARLADSAVRAGDRERPDRRGRNHRRAATLLRRLPTQSGSTLPMTFDMGNWH